MLSIKRTVHVQKDVEIGFPVAELVEKFTDEQLKTVGLYRDLSDADLARLQAMDNELRARLAVCDDDDCECEAHQVDTRTLRRAPKNIDASSERAFWTSLRACARRRDANAVLRLLEERAWNAGGVTVDLTSIITPKG